ncbi:Crp/Fnr family transcriptional regulator [Listeria grandensis]|uniref:Crp/Fnr family transcriptional regulator n=2 Tax=Listeria grandensis TaxID=1494963 RepID=A0A7X0Y3A4_9LIST|nr:Crp/Fnr family transcriptional regulator [Listeria grandensis]MBC1935824.1 Crp/Fnr family transcriptional regulator [Listeria grandensis]
MYSESFFPNIKEKIDAMQLLRSDPDFHECCYEKRIKKGEVLTRKIINNNLFFIEAGVMKFSYAKDQAFIFQHFLEPTEFLRLTEYEAELPMEYRYEAITDIVGWVIDFPFFERVLAKEDPHNFILMQHFLRTRKKFFQASIRANLDATERVYFCIYRLMYDGFHAKPNSIELPMFVNYVLLADMANVSKSLVTLVCKSLREDGILVSSKRPWTIIDVKRFMELMAQEKIPIDAED